MRDKYGLNLKENSFSFNSGGSFESFGSIGLDEALVILNPFEFTVCPDLDIYEDIIEESSLIEKSNNVGATNL